MEERMIRIGVTHGDINGIGYEIILKTFSDSRVAELCTPIIYGSSKIAAYHRKTLELPSVNVSNISKVEDAGNNRINIINCVNEETKVELGKPSEAAGKAALKALDSAIADIKRKAFDALVTAPVNMQSFAESNFMFPSQTAYLEEKLNPEKNTLSILVFNDLRIGLATGNIPLSEVASKLTKEYISDKLRLFHQSLKEDFNIVKPRIAVLALNPHAGETGLSGNEEETIIIPAMREAEKQGVLSFGPYAADGFFGSQMYEKFDGILALYHDQGMIPFKTLHVLNGLSYTAGLPIIHTSPIHGSAYDISGQNIASEDSFRQAIYMAIDIFRNRKTNEEASRNPLRKQYFEKGGDENIDLTKEEETD